MPAQLNHTIVNARDNRASATFLSEMLGLPAPEPYGPFMEVKVANGVSLDFIHNDGEINRHDGGRGVCWADPDGHWLEIITRPYGSGSS